MSFWHDRGEETLGEILPPRLARARATGFVENFGAALDATMVARRTISPMTVKSDAYDPIIERLNEGVFIGDRLANPHLSTPHDPVVGPRNRRRDGTEGTIRRIWDEIARRRAAGDPLPGIPADRASFDEAVNKSVRDALQQEARVGSSATIPGMIGGFAGGMAAAMSDPPNFLSIGIGAPAAWGVLRTAAVEGLINVGIEGASLPAIARWRREVDAGLTAEEALLQVSFAFGGGVLLGGGLKALKRFLNPAQETINLSKADLLRATEGSADAEVRAAHQAARREVEADTRTLGSNGDEIGEARQRLDTATAAVDRNVEHGEVSLSERPAFDPVPPERLATGDDLDGLVFRFAPDELVVDAKRFQFKTGAGALGVTERLAGIEVWDPVKAGQVVVWESLEGVRFITDGHQRRALALRLDRPDARVRLYGYLLREADGFDDLAAREISAIKNVAEGTGTAADAAKILRASPARLKELPLSSALVRAARDLVKLSDEAFMMVVNDIVPERYGAAVGRLAEASPELHAQIIAILAKAEPDNQTQAESIIAQALQAGVSRETEISLFGEADVAVLLFAERARVLDGAIKKLKRDRTVFATLTEESTRIEEAGNRLAGDVNELRAREDGEAIEVIKRLANRKGPLGDALNDAAAVARESGAAAGIGQFTQAVRDLSGSGGLARLVAGAGRRGGEAAAEARAGAPVRVAEIADEPAADFAEPVAGAGQADQAARLEADLRRDIPEDGESGISAPVGERVGDDGIVTAEIRTAEEMLEDLDADDKFVETLDLICGPKK